MQSLKITRSVYIILILIFFSRSLVYLGLPSILNQIHFIFVIFFMYYLVINSLKKDKLLYLIFLYSLVVLISGIINSSSFSNIIIYILITSEPFLIFYIFSNYNLKKNEVDFFRKIIFFVTFLNLFLMYYQYFFLGLRNDEVRGVFLNLGAGAHITAAINTLLAFYLWISPKFTYKVFNYLIIVLLLTSNFLSDAKQNILTFGSAFIIYFIYDSIKRKKFFPILQIVIYLIIFYFFINYLSNHTNLLSEYQIRSLEDIIDGFRTKLVVYDLITSNFNDVYNYFFGLGPGSTTSRLARMIPDYMHLPFLNLTGTNLTNEIFIFQQSNYVTATGTGSSIFSLFFFWASIFGDVGLISIFIYIYIWIYILKKNNYNSFIFMLIALLFVKGFIFDWPEEPIFTTMLISIIVLRMYENISNP